MESADQEKYVSIVIERENVRFKEKSTTFQTIHANRLNENGNYFERNTFEIWTDPTPLMGYTQMQNIQNFRAPNILMSMAKQTRKKTEFL